jgi:hypothetical protein
LGQLNRRFQQTRKNRIYKERHSGQPGKNICQSIEVYRSEVANFIRRNGEKISQAIARATTFRRIARDRRKHEKNHLEINCPSSNKKSPQL